MTETDDGAGGTVAAQLLEADAAVRAECEGAEVDEIVEVARLTFSALLVVRDEDWLRSYAEDVHAGRPTSFAETGL